MCLIPSITFAYKYRLINGQYAIVKYSKKLIRNIKIVLPSLMGFLTNLLSDNGQSSKKKSKCFYGSNYQCGYREFKIFVDTLYFQFNTPLLKYSAPW